MAMQAVELTKLREALRDYSTTYLGNDGLELHERFDLAESWRGNITIQNASAQGCYFLCDSCDALLYIGKASMGSSIGARVASHFLWNGSDLSPANPNWTASPVYLRTVVVSNPWEAGSLEEYLIHHLNPPFNVAGRTR